MAYGCKGSLDHAVPRIEKASALLAEKLEIARSAGLTVVTTYEEEILRELLGAVAYLADAVRYLKDGVP